MNRSSIAQPLLALAVVMALIVGFAVTVASPATAQAQDTTGASLTLQASPLVSEQAFRTVAVALEPGQTGLAALGAALAFDTDAVTVTSCAISEVGACNVLDDGRVLVSVFNLSSLRANEQLLTVNFEPVPEATGSTSFELVVTTAVAVSGEKIADISGDTIEVEVVNTVLGSVTGTVIAEDTATALYDIDVCVTHDVTGAEACTPSSGLGNWRIDDLATGNYAVTASDATAVYAAATATGVVVEDQVASVDELVMTYVVDDVEPAIEEEAQPTVEPVPTFEPAPAIAPDPTIVVVYGASITGQVNGLQTEAPIEAAQVCATQPFVLHQSCATTDADGQFVLSGLSTGNYWVEVVDPLGRFEQIRPSLVGVASDETTRDGVNITMHAIAD